MRFSCHRPGPAAAPGGAATPGGGAATPGGLAAGAATPGGASPPPNRFLSGTLDAAAPAPWPCCCCSSFLFSFRFFSACFSSLLQNCGQHCSRQIHAAKESTPHSNRMAVCARIGASRRRRGWGSCRCASASSCAPPCTSPTACKQPEPHSQASSASNDGACHWHKSLTYSALSPRVCLATYAPSAPMCFLRALSTPFLSSSPLNAVFFRLSASACQAPQHSGARASALRLLLGETCRHLQPSEIAKDRRSDI